MNHRVVEVVKSNLAQVKKNIHHMLIDNPDGITIEFVQNRLAEQNIHKDEKSINGALYNLGRENRAVCKRRGSILVWYPGEARPVAFGRATRRIPSRIRAAMLKMENQAPSNEGYLARDVYDHIVANSNDPITIIQVQGALSSGATLKKKWVTRTPDSKTGKFRYKLLPDYMLMHSVPTKPQRPKIYQQTNLTIPVTKGKKMPENHDEAPWKGMPCTKAIISIMQTYGDGEMGHSLQDLHAMLGVIYTEKQIHKALLRLKHNKFVTTQRRGIETRYFIGPERFEFHHTRNKQWLALETLKYLDLNKPNNKGYTTDEVGEQMHTTYGCAKSSASSACSHLFQKGLLHKQKDHTTLGYPLRYRLKNNPTTHQLTTVADKQLATPAYVPMPTPSPSPAPAPPPAPPPASAPVSPEPEALSTSSHLHARISKVYDETKAIVYDALTNMEIPKDKRGDVFALIDAFDALLGKL